MTICPLRATTGTPLTSMLTVLSLISSSSGRVVELLDDAAPAVVDHVLELVAEVLEEALHRPRGGVAERADGVALDAARDVDQQLQVVPVALPGHDPADHAVHPAGAFAARRALAARLTLIEAAQA